MTYSEEKNWKERVFSHWDHLDALAHQRFKDANLASEALLFTMEQLERDDWKRVRAFQGRAQFKTFLTSLASRLFVDFSRKKFGRIRPPSWLKKMGPMWESLFKLLCLERQNVHDAIESLSQSVPEGRDAELIQHAAFTILEKITDCGKSTGQEQAVEPEILEQAAVANIYCTVDAAETNQKLAVLKDLYTCIIEETPSWEAQNSQHYRAMEKIRTHLAEKVQLGAEQRLLLKMIYQDGLKVSAAGRMLGLSADQAHWQQKKLLADLQAAIEQTGIVQGIKDLLQD